MAAALPMQLQLPPPGKCVLPHHKKHSGTVSPQIPQMMDMLEQVQSIGGPTLQPTGLDGSAPIILVLASTGSRPR